MDGVANAKRSVQADPVGRLGAGGGGGLGGAALPSWADDAPRGECDGPAAETFGTASASAAIVSAAVRDGFGYVVTRGQTPPVLAEIDLATRELTRTAEMGAGDGAWGIAVSGSSVYIATYAPADLYRFDVDTGAVKRLGSFGDNSMVFCATTTPDGKVYCGTYPRGEVWGYDPRNGDMWNLGRADATDTYVRAIAADDTHVYACTIPDSRRVIAFDRRTGARQDITPGDFGAGAVMHVRDGRIYAALGKDFVDFATDGSDPKSVPIPDGDGVVDAMTSDADGRVYCVGRPTGTVYEYAEGALKPIAAPVPGDEHRAIIPLPDGKLLGAAGSGLLWWLDPAEGTSDTVDLLDTGLSGPELVQSVTFGPSDTVHVGGHFALTTHHPGQGDSSRMRVAGEPKQLRVVDDRMYGALYPSTELFSIPAGGGELTSYGRIGNKQSRPTDMEYVADIDSLLVTSSPGPGKFAGALTVLRRSDHTFTVHTELIPDQGIMSVAVADGIAYLGGDVYGGGGADPVQPSASVVAFDLASGEVTWRKVPYEGDQSLQHVVVLDGVLYGLYKRPAGKWFAMDLANRKVLRNGTVDGYGELAVHDGQVFAITYTGRVYRIGPDLDQAVTVFDDLGRGWYTPAQLSFEPSGWYAWSLKGRELARLRLDPAC